MCDLLENASNLMRLKLAYLACVSLKQTIFIQYYYGFYSKLAIK